MYHEPIKQCNLASTPLLSQVMPAPSCFAADLEFSAILPGGKIFRDVPSFLESQLPWFHGSAGSFEFTLERSEVSGDLGAVISKVEYRDVDAHGKPFALEISISFIFRRVKDRWFLIHDQNTVLRETR